MNDIDESKTAEPVVRCLDEWQAELDPVQRARLAAARRRALEERSRRSWAQGWLGPALAASLLLGAGIAFWPPPAMLPAAPTPDELVVVDPADDPLLDEDAEYLLWLASNDDAA